MVCTGNSLDAGYPLFVAQPHTRYSDIYIKPVRVVCVQCRCLKVCRYWQCVPVEKQVVFPEYYSNLNFVFNGVFFPIGMLLAYPEEKKNNSKEQMS